MEETASRKDLARRLEVLDANLYPEDDETLKDTSTNDADSFKEDSITERDSLF